jgi:hypothetical protein
LEAILSKLTPVGVALVPNVSVIQRARVHPCGWQDRLITISRLRPSPKLIGPMARIVTLTHRARSVLGPIHMEESLASRVEAAQNDWRERNSAFASEPVDFATIAHSRVNSEEDKAP